MSSASLKKNLALLSTLVKSFCMNQKNKFTLFCDKLYITAERWEVKPLEVTKNKDL